MKRSIALLTVAAAAILLASTLSAPIAFAQDDYQVIVPLSSMEAPGDLGLYAHTNYVIVIPRHVEILPSGAPVAENPASMACIYNAVKQTKGCPKVSKVLPSGGTKAIAIVDAFDNPDAVSDLKAYATAYGYKQKPKFKVVKVGNPQPNANWSVEESLDIEMAFGMAPNAQIYLVEANSNNNADLYAAEDVATKLVQKAGGGEITNSWSGSEYGNEKSDDSHFKGKGVVYFASSGDAGGVVGYPSTSPYVISAGGTQIVRDGNGNFLYEEGWSSAGGGPSTVEPRPKYQDVVKKIVGSHRGTPDFSGNASPASAVALYNLYACRGWCETGGTSVTSPFMAGFVNAAGQFNASTNAELTEAYKEYGNAKQYKTYWTDVVKGNAGRYSCGKGYEFCTGIGSPLTLKGK